MNKDDGVTFIELLIVVSIIGILVVALGFSFGGWMGNYRIESQIKSLYADLLDTRSRAMTMNSMHFIVLNADDYTIYRDMDDDMQAEPLSDLPIPGFAAAKKVQYTIGWNGTMGFDTRGSAWVYTAPNTRVEIVVPVSIPLALPSGCTPDYDCISIDQARVQTGKMTGANCVPK